MPRIDTVERLATVLGVSPGWLAYGMGSEEATADWQPSASVGDRLREARLSRGLSRAPLGSVAQTTGQTVANIEAHGMVPRVDTVELLAKALNQRARSWITLNSDGKNPLSR